MKQSKSIDQIDVSEKKQELPLGGRGIYLRLKDQLDTTGVLPILAEILGEEKYSLFSWIEDHNGTDFRVSGILKKFNTAP